MLDKIRDRGNKKWSMAMMLPEHVEKIKKWKDADNYIERPQFDEWELQGLQGEIELAYKRQSEVSVSVWKAGRMEPFIGKISKLDQRLNLIWIEGPFGEDRVPVVDLVRVECMY